MAETKHIKEKKNGPIARWREFFNRDLWRADYSALSPLRRNFYQTLQVLALVRERFFSNKVSLQAGALTYSTVLSIVPLLAFMFALLKGMGVQDRLEPVILERVSAGSQEMVARFVDYIDKVNVGSLGVVGLAVLILTVIFVLSNIENAFNGIWGVTTQRSYQRKFADYLSIIIVTPIFLLLALSVTASLKSSWVVGWLKSQPGIGMLVIFLLRLFPYLALWFVMTFLFMFMPNTRVRFKPALIAGVLTGTVWQLTQWGYITFQIGVGKYNAIYGTFAQIPIMLVWIYISWVIVLFGAEFTYAFQNLSAYRQERNSGELTAYARVELALAFLREVQDRFRAGAEPWTAEAIADRHGVPLRMARQVLDELVLLNYLSRVQLRRARRYSSLGYLPARAFAALRVSEVLEKLETVQPGKFKLDASYRNEFSELRRPERELLDRTWQARRSALENETLDRAGGGNA